MNTHVKSPVASLCFVCSSVKNLVSVMMSVSIFGGASPPSMPLVAMLSYVVDTELSPARLRRRPFENRGTCVRPSIYSAIAVLLGSGVAGRAQSECDSVDLSARSWCRVPRFIAELSPQDVRSTVQTTCSSAVALVYTIEVDESHSTVPQDANDAEVRDICRGKAISVLR
ncbi:hypothetical protein MRB53_037308 [Persea americana]|nr:hypothetical protein MRB53_037308 [Persea americana]